MLLNFALLYGIIRYNQNQGGTAQEVKHMIRNLKYIPYGQAKVIITDNGVITLRSYATDVARIQDGFLIVYGLYSRTTIRHISAFVKEYVAGADYYTAKKCYTDNLIYRIADKKFFAI